LRFTVTWLFSKLRLIKSIENLSTLFSTPLEGCEDTNTLA